MYSCHFMDQMDKENTLYGICSFCLFVIILAESQNDFAHLESRGCKNLNITHLDLLVFLLRNALLSLLEVEAGQVKHELLSFPMTIVVKKLQNLKKWRLSWRTMVVVNWISLGHQRQAAVSGKGHKHWGWVFAGLPNIPPTICSVPSHTFADWRIWKPRPDKGGKETRSVSQSTMVKPWHVMIIWLLVVCPPPHMWATVYLIPAI